MSKSIEKMEVQRRELDRQIRAAKRAEVEALAQAKKIGKPVEYVTPSGERAAACPDGETWGWVGGSPLELVEVGAT